jgi:hypothetical protein
MTQARLLLGLCLLGALMVMLSSVDSTAYAQKKKTETKQVAPEPTPPAPQPAKVSSITLKDFLLKYKGTKTSMGMLVRVEVDFFVVEDDGVTTVHPLSNIQYIRVNKPEEGEEDPVLITISMK